VVFCDGVVNPANVVRVKDGNKLLQTLLYRTTLEKISMSNHMLVSTDPLYAMASALRHQAEKKLEEAEQMLAPASRLAGISKSLAEQLATGLRRNAAELRRNANAIQAHHEPLVIIEDRKTWVEDHI
jgi:hypothetical protein